ncbi:hypothetical protein FHY11_001982 [Xanthomonas arboricola]|uniref:hypothetical protein n=1 Tax=Xanthomonas euroxanthea TaxID=2259622 RepID=UPI001ABB3871|nr:hypothetical protein [Xanthomonas euroxanthea]NIK08472.1 hypothetical protein [Xanthomonas euroxanthea]
MNVDIKIRLIFATGLLALSTLAACAGGNMRSDYKKNDVQPVKIKNLGDSLQITYHMPAESLFYSPGIDFANEGGVLRIAIRRCGVNEECDAMAKAALPPAEPWTPKVTVPYAGEKVVLVYSDSEETLAP